MEGSSASEFTMSGQFGNAANPAMQPPNPAAAEFTMSGQFGNAANPAMPQNPAAAEFAMSGQFGNAVNRVMPPNPAAAEFAMSGQFGNVVHPAMPPPPAAAEFTVSGQLGNVVNPPMLPNPAAAEFAMSGQFGNVVNPAMPPPPAAAEFHMYGQFGNMVDPAILLPPPAAADAAMAAPEVNFVPEIPAPAVEPVGPVGGRGQASQAVGGGNSTEKKKRGRPRKNESRENSRTPARTSGSGHLGSSNRVRTPVSDDMFARSACPDFITQSINVNPGEDVVRKITSTVFAESRSRGFCVLSASGSVSRVAFSQPGNPGNLLTYEGRFDLVTLSGSISAADASGGGSRTGGFGVSVAGPDGRLIGGTLAGRLIAGSPVSLTVASFLAPSHKNKLTQRRNKNLRGPNDPVTVSPIAPPGSATGIVAPIPEANPSQGNVLASPVQAGSAQQPIFIPMDDEVITGIDNAATGLDNLANVVAGSRTHNVPAHGAGPSDPAAK